MQRLGLGLTKQASLRGQLLFVCVVKICVIIDGSLSLIMVELCRTPRGIGSLLCTRLAPDLRARNCEELAVPE